MMTMRYLHIYRIALLQVIDTFGIIRILTYIIKAICAFKLLDSSYCSNTEILLLGDSTKNKEISTKVIFVLPFKINAILNAQ